MGKTGWEKCWEINVFLNRTMWRKCWEKEDEKNVEKLMFFWTEQCWEKQDEKKEKQDEKMPPFVFLGLPFLSSCVCVSFLYLLVNFWVRFKMVMRKSHDNIVCGHIIAPRVFWRCVDPMLTHFFFSACVDPEWYIGCKSGHIIAPYNLGSRAEFNIGSNLICQKLKQKFTKVAWCNNMSTHDMLRKKACNPLAFEEKNVLSIE